MAFHIQNDTDILLRRNLYISTNATRPPSNRLLVNIVYDLYWFSFRRAWPNLECLSNKNFFKLSSKQTRGHGFKLYKQFSSSTLRSSFFAQRVINVWNSLPTSVDFRTISAFKRSLQCVNLNEFLTVYKSFDAYDCV